MANLAVINAGINSVNNLKVEEKRRNFESFLEDSIYLFSINIYQGVGTRKIEWQHLAVLQQNDKRN